MINRQMGTLGSPGESPVLTFAGGDGFDLGGSSGYFAGPSSDSLLLELLRSTNLEDLREKDLAEWIDAATSWATKPTTDIAMQLEVISVLGTVPWYRYDDTAAQSKALRVFRAFERLATALVQLSSSSVVLPIIETILKPFVMAARGAQSKLTVHLPTAMICRILSVAAGKHPQVVEASIAQCIGPLFPKEHVPVPELHATFARMMVHLATAEDFAMPDHVASVMDRASQSPATPGGRLPNRMRRFVRQLMRVTMDKLYSLETTAYNQRTKPHESGRQPSMTASLLEEAVVACVCAVNDELSKDVCVALAEGRAATSLPWMKDLLTFHGDNVLHLCRPIALQYLVPSLTLMAAGDADYPTELADLVHRCLSTVFKAPAKVQASTLRAGQLTRRPLTFEERTTAARHLFPLVKFVHHAVSEDLVRGTTRRLFKTVAAEVRNTTTPGKFVEALLAQGIAICRIFEVDVDPAQDVPGELLYSLLSRHGDASAGQGPALYAAVEKVMVDEGRLMPDLYSACPWELKLPAAELNGRPSLKPAASTESMPAVPSGPSPLLAPSATPSGNLTSSPLLRPPSVILNRPVPARNSSVQSTVSSAAGLGPARNTARRDEVDPQSTLARKRTRKENDEQEAASPINAEQQQQQQAEESDDDSSVASSSSSSSSSEEDVVVSDDDSRESSLASDALSLPSAEGIEGRPHGQVDDSSSSDDDDGQSLSSLSTGYVDTDQDSIIATDRGSSSSDDDDNWARDYKA